MFFQIKHKTSNVKVELNDPKMQSVLLTEMQDIVGYFSPKICMRKTTFISASRKISSNYTESFACDRFLWKHL